MGGGGGCECAARVSARSGACTGSQWGLTNVSDGQIFREVFMNVTGATTLADLMALDAKRFIWPAFDGHKSFGAPSVDGYVNPVHPRQAYRNASSIQVQYYSVL